MLLATLNGRRSHSPSRAGRCSSSRCLAPCASSFSRRAPNLIHGKPAPAVRRGRSQRSARMTSVEAHPACPNSGRLSPPTAQLRNGNPSGPKFGPSWTGRKCGARTRAQRSCANPAMPNGRCRMHGGKSTGPRTRKELASENRQEECGPRTPKPSKAGSCRVCRPTGRKLTWRIYPMHGEKPVSATLQGREHEVFLRASKRAWSRAPRSTPQWRVATGPVQTR